MEYVPWGAGTALRLTEVGFREMGWEVAVLEEQYQEHVVGWDTHLAHLVEYTARVASTQGLSSSTTISGRRSGTRPVVGC